MDPRATRRGRTGVRSPASSSIRSSIDASFISFAFNQFGELLEPAMDIHFDERLALPANLRRLGDRRAFDLDQRDRLRLFGRSEEHTSELQSLMRISYAVFCLKKKTNQK